LKPLAAVQADLDGPGAIHHVGVGDDEPARIDDEARAGAASGLRALLAGAAPFSRARCTRTWTSPDWSRSARSASRVLNRARSGAALAVGFSRHIAPPPVDGPAHPAARPPTAIRGASARRREPIIPTLPRKLRTSIPSPRATDRPGDPASELTIQ